MIVFLCVLFIITLLTLIIVFSYIEINIENIEIDSSEKVKKILTVLIKEKEIKNKLDVFNYVSFDLEIRILLFNKIPILTLRNNNYQIKEKIIKQYNKEMNKSKKQINKDKRRAKFLIKNILPKIVIKQSNLDVAFGNDNAASTAIIVTIANILISSVLPYAISKDDSEKVRYEIKPIYLNKNVFFLQFSGIIALKIVHIIKIICKKEEKIRNE